METKEEWLIALQSQLGEWERQKTTLVRAGKNVLVLEKGPRLRTQDDIHGNPLSDFKRDELFGFGTERVVTIPDMLNTGASFYPGRRQLKSDPDGDVLKHVRDWPIAYDDLAPCHQAE